MLRIGLTGGIGSGKSTVAALFAEHAVPVIDADAIAHRLTLPGGIATEQIIQAFGTDILAPDKSLDRKRLGARVFNDPAQRARLEAILHPLIRAEMQSAMRQLKVPYCLLMIPLLIETRQQDMVDRILVVDVDENTQLLRTQARDGRSADEIRAILAAQIDRSQRLKQADDCITNNDDVTALKAQVDALHRKYVSLAAQAVN